MLKGLNEGIALPVLAPRPIIEKEKRVIEGVTGRSVLITGAGGSIGSELVCQVAEAGPKHILLLDHSEFNLYDIMCTLEENGLGKIATPFLADIRDKRTLDAVFRHTIDTVLHAAAYKHVPLLEGRFNAVQGMLTNVLGTHDLMIKAHHAGARFVMISTDKAVHPTSFMGLTKRLGEMVCIHRATTSKQELSIVRFGNVMGSSGSVIPLFNRQIAQGGPVTVTDPNMVRYFMTIKDAVELTLSTLQDTRTSKAELYVLDMGHPVKIVKLAEQLIEQAGFRVNKDIKIAFTGIRPGEKLEEELNYEFENMSMSITPMVRVADMSHQTDGKGMQIGALLDAIEDRNFEKAMSVAKSELVPTYVSGGDV